MNYYLIDYENVHAEGFKVLNGMTADDTVIIFYSDNSKNITFDILEPLMSSNTKLKCFKVNVGTKNALDFQLTSYLGYLLGQEGVNGNYYIVSDDNGFDVALEFWKRLNYSVNRITVKSKEIGEQPIAIKATAKKKKSKVSSKDIASLAEITALIGNNNEPNEVLTIFNKYKTKQAICNGMAKYFKDSKRTSDVYKKLKPLLKSKNKS
ncbi:hypothetical protein SAMN02910413_1165 [Pseudobutyrivibrio sp. C4]|uniref:PIN domain-containing protein n=1 Tax=Pseudobutyrivibrio sp. C4 TaxID=1520803 RepID=UPI0008C77C69|nr:PIN domain-containing protein [Pseudobutyrivibrio sp. C4]SES89811.1 hypothetical protein SAMN02910413_1165 [Pseudobutyrivibrio sp. C4]